MARPAPSESSALRRRLFEIVFQSNDPPSRAFDLALIVAIVLSVFVVMLESVDHIRAAYQDLLRAAEWVFTILFTIEYALRLWIVRRKRDYVFSFYGLVDLLSIIPTYLSVLVPGAQFFLIVRILRVLRVFRVLKLANYLDEADQLRDALVASRHKIAVFIYAVLTIVVVMGSLMYLIEGGENGFTSIPKSVYWAVVTLTTVGYGDIAPQTTTGQALALVIMVMGYGIIAVPTGIVTAELSRAQIDIAAQRKARRCSSCAHTDHDPDAAFCKHCGEELPAART